MKVIGVRRSSIVIRRRVAALSITPTAREWLRHTTGARVLHIFDRACNLVNAAGEIVSLVSPELREGPFTIVIPLEMPFSRFIDVDSRIAVHRATLDVGDLRIATSTAREWNPRPRWEDTRQALSLDLVDGLLEWLCTRAPSDSLAHALFKGPGSRRTGVQSSVIEVARRPIAALQAGIARGDPALCRSGARGLAGLGAGLTPAGDDFLLGAMVAIWSACPSSEAAALAESIASASAPFTTSLSAAWLQAAARGEVAAPWHDLISSIARGDRDGVLSAAERILNTGHTSGADALAGFVVGLGAALPLVE